MSITTRTPLAMREQLLTLTAVAALATAGTGVAAARPADPVMPRGVGVAPEARYVVATGGDTASPAPGSGVATLVVIAIGAGALSAGAGAGYAAGRPRPRLGGAATSRM